MKVIFKNTKLEFQTKETLVEQNTSNNVNMSDTYNPGKIIEESNGHKLYVYKNISGGNLQFNLTGKGNTWTRDCYLYGIFDEEPVVGSKSNSYHRLGSAGEVFDLNGVVPNGKYLGVSDYAYAPESGGSCTVTYKKV